MTRGLFGTFNMNCDSKARVTLPAAHRKVVGATVVLLPFDGRVYGFTPEGFTAWIDQLFEQSDHAFDPRNRDDVRLRTGLMSLAVSVDIDSAGRIALGKLDVAHPGRREELGLTSEITIVGADDHFEVWNTAKWTEQNAALEDQLVSLFYRN